MIRTNQVTKTQVALSHMGNHIGEFRKMTPGVWFFTLGDLPLTEIVTLMKDLDT